MDFKPVLRMMVCSDVHFGDSENNPEKFGYEGWARDTFERCVAFAREYGELDVFVAVGDFVTSGTEKQMRDFKASLDKALSPDTKILLPMASHEYFSEGVEAANEKLLRIFGKQPTEMITVKGYSFIASSTDDRCQTGIEKQEWIANALKTARENDKDKPIFFFFHPQFQNTVYGSAVLWRTSAIMRTVMNYPQVVAFSGHSHAPINDPRNIHQRHFTCFGTGAIIGLSCCDADRLGLESKTVGTSQFLIVEADEKGNLRVTAIDGTNGKPIREWRLSPPYRPENFIYTDDRYLTASKPIFDENASFIAGCSDGLLTVAVSQATDESERVPGYHFSIEDENGYIIKQFDIGSGYHLYDLPEKATYTLPFEYGTGKYKISCRAISFYDIYSDPIFAEFTV